MISFGTIRGGTQDYSVFSNTVWAEQYRYINNGEVPSVFPLSFMGWRHAGTEVWEHEGVAHMCEPYIEDPNCMTRYKWKPYMWSLQEHEVYFGLTLFPICNLPYTIIGE